MPDVELVPEGAPDGPAEEEHEEARQFILKVKETVERCLEQRMNKAAMFRVIREEGLSTWIAFAVFKELREQNYDFFKEYYCMHNLKEQRERFGHLIQAYRAGGGGNGAAGVARALETAATAAAMMETDDTASMEWSSNQQNEEAWLDGELAHLLASSTLIGGGDPFAGDALPHQSVHFPVGQQPHHDQQTVYVDWLREMAPWAEEAAPMLAPEQLHDNEQPEANGMFQEMAWLQQAAHSPAPPQLHYQEQPVQIPALPQQPYQEQPVQIPALSALSLSHRPYQEQAGQLLAGQQLPCLEPAGQLPAGQELHYAMNLPGQQQLLCQLYQEQLITNGGFHGPPPTMAAGLPSDTMMDPWPLSQVISIGWGQEQQDEPPKQQEEVNLPGQQQLLSYQYQEQLTANGGFHGAPPTLPNPPLAAGLPSHTMMDPSSSTLPGGELLGNQNFRSGNAGAIERPHQ